MLRPSHQAIHALALLVLVGAGSRPAFADNIPGPVVKLDVTEGQTLSDRVTISAKTLPSPDGSDVNKVDFAVDDQVKYTDTSVPYTFDFDTLDVTDGQHTISAAATDEKGRRTETKVTVTVDNGLSQGADYHANLALEALKSGDTPTAERESRRALKLDPKNVKVARALAKMYRAKGDIKAAFNALDQAAIPETDADGRLELARLHALVGMTAPSTAAMVRELKTAATMYRDALAQRKPDFAADDGAATKARRLGDTKAAMGDWEAAIAEYTKAGSPENLQVDLANRLIVAYLNAGRLRDARGLVSVLEHSQRANAATRGLSGLVYLAEQQFGKARDAVKAEMLNPGPSTPLVCYLAAAYGASAQGDLLPAKVLADAALGITSDLAEVFVLRTYVLTDISQRREAAARAVELNPVHPDAYAAAAYVAIAGTNATHYALADTYVERGLDLDMRNTYVKVAKVLSLMGQHHFKDAESAVITLEMQYPNSADVHMLAAVEFTGLDKRSLVYPEMEKALRLDPRNWNDPIVPRYSEIIDKMVRWRVPLALSPFALDYSLKDANQP